MKDDYKDIENWTLAKTNEALEELEPVIRQLREQRRNLTEQELSITSDSTDGYRSWVWSN